MASLGPMELIIILVIVIIVFGVGRLPEVGGALGKGIREFRRASEGADEEEKPSPAPVAGNDSKGA
ncbi:MAG: twin-arginine translocase TatA/TatE family subunit [Chloroflexi bacterium]|nr:twin-arginine translocase TatA/TatE family subunit [Chloroflexota bacterium]